MLHALKHTLKHLPHRVGKGLKRLLMLYRPHTLRKRGWLWSSGLLLLTLIVALYGLGVYWSQPPVPFNVRTNALAMADGDQARVVPGYTTTAALIRVAQTLLDKPGGYLSNDVMPPTSLFGTYQMLDNMPSWEFGALIMVRDTSRVLRNDFSRSQSQSLEDPDLAKAEPHFSFDNNSWLFPSTESEYRKGIVYLQRYLHRLSNPADPGAQFYTRADNLNDLLAVVGKRLGSLSQRLNASVGELRINTALAGDSAARQATATPGSRIAKTPWMQIDNVFYESRGYVWALLEVLRAVNIDFHGVLQKKNAVASLRQVILLLQQSQVEPSSPIVLNGAPMGWMANYSKTMVSYISPANAAIIDLRNLLARG